MKIPSKIVPIAFLVALGCVTPVFGALSCTGSGVYFAETGVSPSDPTKQQDSEACVTITGNNIQVVVQSDNTVVTNVPSILDGFSLQLNPAPAGSITGIAFGADPAVVATDFIECASKSCASTSDGKFHDGGGTDPSTVLNSPFNWGVITTTKQIGSAGPTIAFSPTNPGVVAGGNQTPAALNPAGIIGSISSTVGETGLDGGGHNDYLLGPVTFNLTYTGTGTPNVAGITFYWGTLGESHTGTLNGTPFSSDTPEPASVLFLGAAFVVCAKFLKARKGSA
jgi:hypothetical protein